MTAAAKSRWRSDAEVTNKEYKLIRSNTLWWEEQEAACVNQREGRGKRGPRKPKTWRDKR